jgi:hypothetical protein
MRRRRSHEARDRRAILVVAVFCLTATAAQAEPRTLLFKAEPPAGFSDLLKPQTTVVDIYFGDRRAGSARATYAPGTLRFDNPAQVVALLPKTLEPAKLAAALTGELPANSKLVCGDKKPDGCGELLPEIAGIIFNEGRFRVDVFVNPKYLAANAPDTATYLPEPDAGVSFLDSLGGTISSASFGPASYTLQNRALIGYHDARLESELSYSDTLDLQVETLSAALDRPDLRYEAGLFWSRGFNFIGQNRLYGVGISSQWDTRANSEQVAGTTLLLYLARRAQVDILRDGRLLASRLYDAGNQILDTSYLPDGSYNVTLRVHEMGGATYDVRRFFVKDRMLPPPDTSGFFFDIGALAASGSGTALPMADNEVFIAGGYARRLGEDFAVDANAMYLGDTLLGEAGVSWFSDIATLRVAGLGATDGNYGVLFNAALTGFETFSANLDVRKTWGPGLTAFNGGSSFTQIDRVNLLIGNTFEASANVSWTIGQVQLFLTATYNESNLSPKTWSYGPSLNWQFFAGDGFTMNLIANASQSNEGAQVFAGVRVLFLDGGFTLTGDAGGAADHRLGYADRSGGVGGFNASYAAPDVLASTVTLNAGLAHTLDGTTANGSAELRGNYGRYLAQVDQDVGGAAPATRVAGSFATSFAVTGDGVAFGGDNVSASAIVVRLDGSMTGMTADVLINGSKRARIRSGESVPVFLPPYHVYDVRLVPVDAPLASFDTRARSVTVYPGNVETLVWDAEPVIAGFGRLLDPSGHPIAGALIDGAREPSESDAAGYFQVEIVPNTTLHVRPPSGPACRVTLANVAARKNGFAPLGDLICQPESNSQN